MKPKPGSKPSKKRKRKINPVSKVEPELDLIRRINRYADRERVLRFLDVKSLEDWPSEFFARAEGQTLAKVTVDWVGVRAGLEAALEVLVEGRSSHLTADALSEAKRFRANDAAFYVLEFLPEVVDSAIAHLYLEALTKVSVELGRPWARTLVEILAKMNYEERVGRLGIHEGPKPRFQHRGKYETALKKVMAELLSEGKEITQERVAEKLTGDSELSVDVRVIRRWNKEFGLNWKAFIKQTLKEDKS